MTEPTLDGLHGRLERLERELAWWRRAGIALLAGVGLLGAVAATVSTNPDEVKTQRLVIVDRRFVTVETRSVIADPRPVIEFW